LYKDTTNKTKKQVNADLFTCFFVLYIFVFSMIFTIKHT